MANTRVLAKRRKAVRNIRKIAELAADLGRNARDVSHPLLATRPVRKALLLVITSNRGFCGGYNGSILREAIATARKLREEGVPFELEVSGKRGVTFFRFQ